MWTKLLTFLNRQPGTKAKDLATILGKDKSEVNQVLYAHRDKFALDENFKWSVICPDELRIQFPENSWLKARDFESVLAGYCTPWHDDCSNVTFVFMKDCKMLLDALARLLALCNQLNAAGKKVTLDFKDCRDTLNYFDRMEFFEVLAPTISVLPCRPQERRGLLYRGNNDGVIELRSIDPAAPDNEIPRLLERCFVRFTDESYSTVALTVIGEPFKNVLDHADSKLPGFAGLQAYKNRTRIQVVISDNGLGIVGTLAPIVQSRYPELAARLAKTSLHPGIELLKEVFSVGQISQMDEGDRGTGLKSSGDLAQKHRARISVRQKDFELRIHHGPDGRFYYPSQNLVRIDGTHISFSFLLDGSKIAR